MLDLVITNLFKKHLKKCKKRGKDLLKIEKIIKLLRKQEPIPLKYKDHKLVGILEGSRDIHIDPEFNIDGVLNSKAFFENFNNKNVIKYEKISQPKNHYFYNSFIFIHTAKGCCSIH